MVGFKCGPQNFDVALTVSVLLKFNYLSLSILQSNFEKLSQEVWMRSMQSWKPAKHLLKDRQKPRETCVVPVHQLAGLYNRNGECLLRGTDWILKHKSVLSSSLCRLACVLLWEQTVTPWSAGNISVTAVVRKVYALLCRRSSTIWTSRDWIIYRICFETCNRRRRKVMAQRVLSLPHICLSYDTVCSCVLNVELGNKPQVRRRLYKAAPEPWSVQNYRSDKLQPAADTRHTTQHNTTHRRNPTRPRTNFAAEDETELKARQLFVSQQKEIGT
jgi:hypothetical protein